MGKPLFLLTFLVYWSKNF